MILDNIVDAYKAGKISTIELQASLRKLKQQSLQSPLSEGQKGLWMLQKMSPEMSAYNIPLCFRISQTLEVEKFQQACQFVLHQHPILASIIAEDKGVPYQILQPGQPLAFQQEDISTMSDQEIITYIKAKAKEPFFLESGPLMRVYLFNRSVQECFILVTIHHIVFDGISVTPFLQTLFAAYHSLVQGKEPVAVPAAANYGDFVAWEQKMLAGKAGAEHRAFWQQQLAGALPILELPADHPRSTAQGFKGQVHTSLLPPELSKKIKELALAQHVNISAVFLGIWKALLYRYTGQEDIIVGMPAIVRPQAQFDSLIGYFINMIPIRSQDLGNKSFSTFLQELQLNMADSLDHVSYPFPVLVRELNVPRTPGIPPVFQVAFFYQNLSQTTSFRDILTGYDRTLPLEFIEEIHQEGEYEFALETLEERTGTVLNCKYNPDLFEPSTIQRMVGHYINLAQEISENPHRIMNEYSLLSPEEQNRILLDWNATQSDYPDRTCFHELFAQQAQRTPDAVAVVHGENTLTYRELDEKSSYLAVYLQKKGVIPDCLIGICTERSLDMIVGLLGILKAGGAYVPLDPDYPLERLQYMIQDSKALFIITQAGLMAKISGLLGANTEAIILDKEWGEIEAQAKPAHLLRQEVKPSHLAYVIYTSGSTGKPKGVMITHKSLTNFLAAMADKPGLHLQDRLLAVTTYCFDIAGLELYLPLICGAQCYICSAETAKDAEKLKQEIQKVRPTIMQATPATWTMLFHTGWNNEAKTKILCGGEALPERLKQCFIETQSDVWNMFGPTETTIWSTVQHIKQEEPITIGKPIANTQIYILDSGRKPVPIGIPGELCIAGDGVARGYLNMPELTAEKFIDNPFNTGTKLYRTGDLARWLPDGNIDFLGRLDHQVKINGFRIELGEIENQLSAHPSMKECAVIVKEEGDSKQLIAYYVPGNQSAEADMLQSFRDYLRRSLPEYMIPAFFIPLAAIPLTPNGKVDRKELMNRKIIINRTKEKSMPQSKVEEKILEIWRTVLNIDDISTGDGFFDVGGDSVLAIVVVEKLKQKLNCNISVTALFKYSNIKELSTYIAGLTGDSDADVSPEQVQFAKSEKAVDYSQTSYPAYYQDSLAIIGISCNFPGAQDHREFWNNLRAGKESMQFFSKEELYGMGLAAELIENPDYVPIQSTITGKDFFDPEFFNLSPRDAEFMDPQLRLLLLHSWKAVEDAGYVSKRIPETSVFMSASNSLYQALLPHASAVINNSDEYVSWALAQGGTIPTMISHKLGLKGPSFFVHSNCSSSLVGLSSAYKSLQSGEAKYALVGASTILPSANLGYVHQPGMNFSSDGHLKAFDASADGMVGGEGVAVILLKKAVDAITDGDHIYALLRGIGVNNDGADKVGFYAPSVKGQSEVIQKVLDSANVHPESIGFVEAHGTGTKLGDPIEFTALSDVYQKYTTKKQFCGLGSVKSNIGHLDTAAGLAGCIKVVLSLYHGEIPPSLHYKNSNPNIDIENSPFYIVDKLKKWEQTVMPYRAALSSFGIGGTNTHAIFEQYAKLDAGNSRESGLYIIPLSARNNDRLTVYAENLLHYLRTLQDIRDNGYDQAGIIEKKIQGAIVEYLAKVVNVSTADIDPNQDFSEQGIEVVELFNTLRHLQAQWEIDIDPQILTQAQSINDLTNSLTEHYPQALAKHFEVVTESATKTVTTAGFPLVDIAYTLQLGREAMESRVAFVVRNSDELIAKLEKFIAGKTNEEICFKGEIKQSTDVIKLFKSDDGFRKVIQRWMADREWRKLAEIWVKGLLVDWELLYADARPQRLSLPTYPFAEERYWAPEFIKSTDNVPAEIVTAAIHPLLHRNTSNFSEQRFSSTFTGKEFFLADHIIKGQRILPGVAHLEMARAAVAQAAGIFPEDQAGIYLKNMVWVRPIIVADDPVQVHIGLSLKDNGEIAYEIYSESDNMRAEPVVYSQGSAVLTEAVKVPDLDIAKLRVECDSNHYAAHQCYEAFRTMGIDYGPGHQGIEMVYVGSGQILAKLVLPFSIAATKDQYILHPSLMDSALQAAIGFVMDTDVAGFVGKASIPFALQELTIIDRCPVITWVSIRYSTNSSLGDKMKKLDIDLCDATGKICVQLKGFSTRVLAAAADLAEHSALLLFEPGWQEKGITQGPVPYYAQHFVIICEPQGISAKIIEEQMTGVQCSILQSQEKGIAGRFQDYALQLFNTIQSILKGKPADKVLVQVVVPLQGEQQLLGGLSGLLKTARLENPKLIGQLLEVEAGVDSSDIIYKLIENSRSPQDFNIRYQQDKRWVFSWLELEASYAAIKAPWKDRGIYLITGGVGGLGLILAKEIAQTTKGAVLILIGRSGINAGKQETLQQLQALGSRIEYRQVDVTQEQEVAVLFQDIEKDFGGLNGIIHCAGVVKDNFIIKKTTEELLEVLAPKVTGLVNLDQASKDNNLDFFVLFSSISGSLGNAGQADYAAANIFMDAFAAYRNSLAALKQRRGKTLSINWPLWADGGMQVDEEISKMTRLNTGMIPLQASAGIQAFYQSLIVGKDQILVLQGNPVQLRSFIGLTSSSQEVIKAAEKVKISDESLERQTIKLVKQTIANVIKISAEKIQVDTAFDKYGIDSIVQMNLIRELEKVTGELSKTLLFEYSTTKELVDYLIENYADKLSAFVTPESAEIPNRENLTSRGFSELPFSSRHKKQGLSRLQSAASIFPGNASIEKPAEDIAIIGISGRYPLSDTLEELWENLQTGRNCITAAADDRWRTSLTQTLSGNKIRQPGTKYYGGFLKEIDRFDHHLFEVAEDQVWELSPELRLFFETVWETFEDAGYSKSALHDLQDQYQIGVGVFVGTMYTQYSWSIPILEQAIRSSNGTDWQIANRISHFFNLTGPSIAVNSACSSSLTAIHLACESLRNKSCSMAVAGGVNLTLDPSKYTALQYINYLGSGSQSKSFGTGDGYIPGEGVGAVLLKPLSTAIQDNDHIYAVIKSSLVNHSGGRQVYTAPDPKQQSRLIINSIQRSGIHPSTIGYVESAANGSELGDPIEVIALHNAFAEYTDEKQYCALGSVKSNLGHLEAASGMSQLSKVILQLQHKTLVPTINANPRNPNIKLERTAFYLQEEAKPWRQLEDSKTGIKLPRRSMINSFGAGGAYANLILEEFIGDEAAQDADISAAEVLVVVSAKTAWSLMQYIKRLQEFLQTNRTVLIRDVAGNLQKLNHDLEYKAAIVVSSVEELIEKIVILQRTGESSPAQNIYISSPRSNADFPSISIEQALQEKDLIQLALHWLAGAAVDFKQLIKESKTNWLGLPKYPFSHEIDFSFTDLSVNNKIAQFEDEFFLRLSEKIANGELSEDEVEQILLLK